MATSTEIIRGLYEAFGKGDVPSVIAAMDPGIVWNEAESFIYADRNPYLGPQAVLDGVFGRVATEWEGFSANVEELITEGDTVVSLGRYRGVYRATGVKMDAQFVHVFKLRNGRVASFQQYTDTAQARDVAAGRAAGSSAR